MTDAVRVSPRARRWMILAEDDTEVLELLSSIFRADGFDVACARDGAQLLQLLEQARANEHLPDIIITDHRMPKMTGLEAASVLKDAELAVPIIVITAAPRELEATDEESVDIVFRKPFDADDLRTAVMYCMEAHGAHTGPGGD